MWPVYISLQDGTGWQGTAGQDRTGQDRAGQDRTGQDRTGQDRKIRFLCRALDVHLIYFYLIYFYLIYFYLSFNYLLLFYSRKYSQNVLHIRRKRHNECCGLRKIPRNYQSSSAYDSLQLDSLLTNERRTIQMVTHSIIAVRPLKNSLTFLRRGRVQIHQKVLVRTAKYRRKKNIY